MLLFGCDSRRGLSRRSRLPDLLEFIGLGTLRVKQIPPKLQIQPQLRGRAEEPRKTECRAWGDATLAVDQLVYPLVWNADSLRKLSLGELHRFEKLEQQDLTRMRWRPMGRNADHVSLCLS
jgi:hypothetical protein